VFFVKQLATCWRNKLTSYSSLILKIEAECCSAKLYHVVTHNIRRLKNNPILVDCIMSVYIREMKS